ncbi:hypothetical protein KY345_02695 [Candidatus Woesearchaeota archaeon]|nr:hypothetical protein [Candidatus Woesearchaeota archaeon]
MGKKKDSKKRIEEMRKREEERVREIQEQILKQQEKVKKKVKKEKKLEEIVEETKVKKKKKDAEKGDYREEKISSYVKYEKLDYRKLFSYLGSGVKLEQYDEASADTSIAWSDERRGKDVMDIKEQSDYAIKQASNMLLGTNMNHISYDEKIRFNAFMTDPSNKIVFLINYAMLGMNYKMPEITKISTQYAEAKERTFTDEQIKEKSMKNDTAISLRFDTKGKDVKEYSK